jgi:hypothetical protein
MREKTITQNLALYEAHNKKMLRAVRRELGALERRYWWRRLKQIFRRLK